MADTPTLANAITLTWLECGHCFATWPTDGDKRFGEVCVCGVAPLRLRTATITATASACAHGGPVYLEPPQTLTPSLSVDGKPPTPWFGCFTGDCPHETQADCDAAIRAELARLERSEHALEIACAESEGLIAEIHALSVPRPSSQRVELQQPSSSPPPSSSPATPQPAFTQEDVYLLRCLWSSAQENGNPLSFEESNAADLAARIASTLPPPTP